MTKELGGLDENLLKDIIRVITAHKPVKKVVLYGSRATGDFKRTADIDLAIMDPAWTSSDINHVHFDLEEDVPTPLKFDLTHFDKVSKENLKEDILNEGITIYES